MRTERNLWRGATTMAIGILLLMMLQTRPEHRDITTPRFDEPGAAPRVCSPLFIPPFTHDPATNNIWLGGKVHSIVVEPDDRPRLYLGTDLGVMVSIDGGRTWMTEETGFGPAVTMWLSLIRTPAITSTGNLPTQMPRGLRAGFRLEAMIRRASRRWLSSASSAI